MPRPERLGDWVVLPRVYAWDMLSGMLGRDQVRVPICVPVAALFSVSFVSAMSPTSDSNDGTLMPR